MLYHKKFLVRAVYSIPVLLSYCLISFNFYLYHIGFLWVTIYTPSTMISTLILYLSNIIGLWAYTNSVLTEPGSIPLYFDLLSEDKKEFISKEEFGVEGSHAIVNYCLKCDRKRPARAHHCMLCGKCVMRMDHHCPWIGNCVGLYNHKFFTQFLVYGSIVAFITAGSCGGLLFDSFETSKNLTFIGFLVSLGISVMLGSLSSYHLWLIASNSSTIELSFYKHDNIFDFGWKENLTQICGKDWLGFFLPIESKNHFLSFPVKIKNNSGETVYFSDKVLI